VHLEKNESIGDLIAIPSAPLNVRSFCLIVSTIAVSPPPPAAPWLNRQLVGPPELLEVRLLKAA
jgi:hypothetical protein